MRCRFVETDGHLAIEVIPETDDQRLLLQTWIDKVGLRELKISGGSVGGGYPGARSVTISPFVPAPARVPCCPHPVERHAYNGCAECGCSVRWDDHPNKELDETTPAREARIAERGRLLARIEMLERRLADIRGCAEEALEQD